MRMMVYLKSLRLPAQEERKQRLKRIVRKGLPPLPQTALELTAIVIRKRWAGNIHGAICL